MPAPPGRGRPSAVRLAVCYATIAACVPYIVLKLAWLSGSTIGWNDEEMAEGAAIYAANAITMGMDAVAVLVALAFTHPWGRRLPAWLVIVPIWVGTGLLAPIVLGLPPGLVIQTISGGPAPATADQGGLQSWVYVIVYTGFVLQGLGLLTAFVLYARDRWAGLLTARTRDLPAGATHAAQSFLALAASLPALGYAAVNLYWGLGGTAGLPPGSLDRTVVQQTVTVVWGLLALAGAAGTLALVHGRGGAGRTGRLWVPLSAAWLGSGATFTFALASLLGTLAQPGALAADRSPAADLTLLSGLLGGLVLGLTGAFFLTEAGGGSKPGP
ncbi:hypothetical protein GCM10010191_85430 [Actinomadura vinacea]|uniref:DUF2834 domain-containing protein n=1 Tax=Actinomadura vinacea TaxID=115336 RepID=A0ABN3KCT9_9ACTN